VREKKVRYKAVREVEFIDAIPKSASGKILRRLLRDRERGGVHGVFVREEKAKM
jgi:4-coumarate--CoA ligase